MFLLVMNYVLYLRRRIKADDYAIFSGRWESEDSRKWKVKGWLIGFAPVTLLLSGIGLMAMLSRLMR